MFEMAKPTWESLGVHCGSCGQAWSDWQPSGCTLPVWISVMAALRCPHCGEEEHLFVAAGENRDAKDLTQPPEKWSESAMLAQRLNAAAD